MGGTRRLFVGVATVVVFEFWQANECYEEYASCGSGYALFELGWLLSVALMTWLLLAGAANLIRSHTVGASGQ
jgi:hypothetical protein